MAHADDRPTALHSTPPVSGPVVVSAVSVFGERPGDLIGPYRLLEILGEGGFGMVWLAERREPFVQRVAIKIIKPGMDSREVIARFEQERQALALMDHPNVARVYDAGATARGRPYFVMEHVAGLPVTDFCDRQRLTNRQRLALFIPVCEAVQHAHQKGIIHRDLKPSNILVMLREKTAVPKVIDFGVAKAVSHALTDKTIFTESGQMIGTPEYMSPEQAEMRAGDVDTRSDVYSLGAVLYELLTGGAPFESRTLRGGGYDGLVRTIRETDPPKPSTRLTQLGKEESGAIAERRRVDRGALAAELRNELEWIPLKALRKDRTERYGSPADLARDIKNYLEGRPLEAGPESTVYRLRKLARRNKGLVAGVSAVAAALIVGVVGFAWQAHRAGVERDAAVAARSATEREKKKADTINAFMQDALKAADPNQGGRQDMLVSDAMESAVQRLDDGAFKEQPELEMGLRYTIAEVLDGNGRSAEALAMSQRGLELARGLHPAAGGLGVSGGTGEADSEVAHGLNLVGGCQQSLGKYADALKSFQQAQEMYQRLAPGGQEAAQSLGNVAEALGAMNREKEALPLYEKSLEMLRGLFPGDDARVATAMNNLAFCLQGLDRLKEALPLYEKSLDMQMRLHPGDHPDVARGLNNVGFCLKAMGKPGFALQKFRQALDMRLRIFKRDHPLVARAMSNVASCNLDLGNADEALKMYERALTIWKRVYPGDHPDVAAGLNSVATCLHMLGRGPEALAKFEESLQMQRRLHGAPNQDHPDVAMALNNVGRERFLNKKVAEAEEPLRDGLAMYQRVAPGDHADTANAMANLAACLDALGKHGEALEIAQNGAAMAGRILPAGNATRKKCEGVLESIRTPAASTGQGKK